MATSLQRRQGVQGHRSLSPRHQAVSPTPQYDPYAPQLGYLSENIHRLLTERECAIFDRGLADYHRRRNIRAFVECLSLVLNTNQKRHLLLPIRDTYVKPSDLVKFNQLVQEHGLATSLKRKKKEEEKMKASSGVHRVEVKRDSNSEWGFSIRGGSEHGIGIFISWVEPGGGGQKSGLQLGDQILKANDVSFENISSYDAVSLMKGAKKLRLWVLSRGRVPTSRMTHKVYRWVSPDGRSASPPPDPFEVQDQTGINEHTVMNEADERKVTVMVDSGQELGISIRGGAEHGLGIYLSAVEEGSVAENYGLKIGDQVLEVNGISFQNIIHADAANALRAQPCMVMKLKDVGKLPHSRITTYGQTQWYQSSQATKSRNPNTSQEPVFKSGVGTQVMHGKQQPGSIQGSGLMNEVARSVLNSQELATFNYYVNQYDQYGLSVEDLVMPLVELLNTPEKLQLLSEVRTLIKARDLQRFNELTVHKEIAAKKAANRQQTSSRDGSLTNMTSPSNTSSPTGYGRHDDSDDFILSPLPPSLRDDTLISQDDEESHRDNVPQKLPSQRPANKGVGVFHAPPPPSSLPSTSTPDGHASPDPQSVLADTLKERRQRTRPGAKENSMDDETWDGQWNETSLMSSIHPPPASGGFDDTDGSADISAIEARVRNETESQLRKEFEEQQQKIKEEQERLLAQEKQEKEMTLRREREQLERQMKEKERKMRAELERQIKLETEQKMKRELEEKERALAAEHEMRAQENEERLKQLEQEDLEDQIRQIEERTKLELEEKIWKEAEEHMRQEFEAKMAQEKSKLQSEMSKSKSNERTSNQEEEARLRREIENKYKREYEERLQREKAQRKKMEQEERQKREQEEKAKREAEVARLEAEEQARIEMEERIRKEAEASARAEYEARLQRETEERARLADEVKVRKAAEERLEREQRKRSEQEKRERERRVRGPETKPKPQEPVSEQYEEPEAEEEESDHEETQEEAASPEDQRMLEVQRRRRQAEEREQQRREEEERRAAEEAKASKDQQRQKKLELQRKREENIRKREEERKQKDAEARQKREQKSDSLQRQTQPVNRLQNGTGTSSKQRKNDNKEEKSSSIQKVKVNFGDDKKPTRQQVVEDARRKAEEKLQRRLRRAQEKTQANSAEGVQETDSAQAPTPSSPAEHGTGISFGGYENLQGTILNITVTKVCKKLGVAIDGGANTKQKAVIIREISPEGCAAQTGMGLSVGQQILSVGGESLYGMKHKDVVLTIKSAFEGPLNKTLDLVVLDLQ